MDAISWQSIKKATPTFCNAGNISHSIHVFSTFLEHNCGQVCIVLQAIKVSIQLQCYSFGNYIWLSKNRCEANPCFLLLCGWREAIFDFVYKIQVTALPPINIKFHDHLVMNVHVKKHHEHEQLHDVTKISKPNQN